MATTRYGLIGCGMMGQEHLRNIALLSGVEVAAIFEPDPDARIVHAELRPGLPVVALPAQHNVYFAPLGELDGVIGKVE